MKEYKKECSTHRRTQEVHLFTRAWFQKSFGRKYADGIRILYGGSVNEDNHLDFKNEEKINGLLIGSACLDPITFSKIINKS